LDLGHDVVFLGLGGEHAFCFVAMALAFAIFLISILHADVLVHKVLAVHVGDGIVGGFEGGVGDESVALGEAGLVARDLGRLNERAETGEGVVEGLLVHDGVEVADEELGADFDRLLLVCGGLRGLALLYIANDVACLCILENNRDACHQI
jgi:hypothetical protein